MVSASPLTRSSHHAGEDFAKLQAARRALDAKHGAKSLAPSRRHGVLPYTPEQLFTLVGDVEAYPQFVPWITAMRTWNGRADALVSTVDAEAQVGFSFLREKFATRVRRDATALTVDVSLLYGPFKRLSNQWRFVPNETGTTVEFVIDFAFKSSAAGRDAGRQYRQGGQQADRLLRGPRPDDLRAEDLAGTCPRGVSPSAGSALEHGDTPQGHCPRSWRSSAP
jgi:coenzyme Q-binding protein COQ10